MIFGKKTTGLLARTTDIIIEAVVAENGDALAAKLQDDNGQRIESHG